MVTVCRVILLAIRAKKGHVRPDSKNDQPHGPKDGQRFSKNGIWTDRIIPMAQCHLVIPGAGVRTCIRNGLLPCAQQAQGKLDLKIRCDIPDLSRFAAVDGTGVI